MSRALDLTGKVFGKLTVIQRVENNPWGKAQWLCQCECGNKIEVISSFLNTGRKTCCPQCSQANKLPFREDLTGLKVGKLTVLGYSKEMTEQKAAECYERKTFWKCQCECGNITYVRTADLKNQHVLSCGCIQKEKSAEIMKSQVQPLGAQSRLIDLTGQRFGRLVVISRYNQDDNSGHPMWVCQCDCGNIHIVSGAALRKGVTQSCGCLGNSTGEALIKQILDQAHIPYKQEYKFDDLIDKKQLRYDFAIFDKQGNLRELIEYDGRQHSDPTSNWYTEEVLKHDQMKTDYARKNNIPLLRISYLNKDKINLLYILSPLDKDKKE